MGYGLTTWTPARRDTRASLRWWRVIWEEAPVALKKLTWWDEFGVADESTDIRGWKVCDQAREEVGEVEDLIFDTDDQRVRYLSIDLDERMLAAVGATQEGPRDKKVLVPVGAVDLVEDQKRVVLHDLTGSELAMMPAYDRDKEIDPETERAIYRAYHPGLGADGAPNYMDPSYQANHPRFRAVELRYTTAFVMPREATFVSAEPADEDRLRRDRDRDGSGGSPA